MPLLHCYVVSLIFTATHTLSPEKFIDTTQTCREGLLELKLHRKVVQADELLRLSDRAKACCLHNLRNAAQLGGRVHLGHGAVQGLRQIPSA